VAGLIALACLGTACSPADQPVIAVEAAGGGVRLLVPHCRAQVVRSFSVFEDDEKSTRLRSWAISNNSWTKSISGVRVFKEPAGWDTYANTLDPLRSGIPYVATMDASVSGKGLKGRVPFSLDDITALEKGQVLVMDGRSGNKSVSRSDFLHGGGKESCG
jgi:hypothetical protein